MKLIVGLGNPGRGYANNRHNIGFLCLSYFAKEVGILFNKKQCRARTGVGDIAGYNVIVARPQTFMNRSGQSVALLLNKFDINHNDLLVIYDDLDLPLGRIRLRPGGSSAGHKGIESIITELESPNFIRIRIGIGQPQIPICTPYIREIDTMAYVLSNFSSEEKHVIKQLMPRVNAAIITVLTDGLTVAMNEYNRV